MLDELKKYIKSKVLTKLSKEKSSVELFEIIFPQLKKMKYFSNPNSFAKMKIEEADFILGCTPFHNKEIIDFIPLLEKAKIRNFGFWRVRQHRTNSKFKENAGFGGGRGL